MYWDGILDDHEGPVTRKGKYPTQKDIPESRLSDGPQSEARLQLCSPTREIQARKTKPDDPVSAEDYPVLSLV